MNEKKKANRINKDSKKSSSIMDALLFKPLKILGTCTKNLLSYSHAQRLDLRKGTGLWHTFLTGTIGVNKGASFLSEKEQLQIFSKNNKGLLIDGKNKRLSIDDSFKHLLLVAQTGAGKTTKYIIPNVLDLADSKNSIIVTDPSGEIYQNTSGYMQIKGFKVLKFDPTDPTHSIYFNPLRYIFSYKTDPTQNKYTTEINETKLSLLASSLAASTMPGSKDTFWRIGAEDLIEFFTACLKETPKEYHNLFNVYRLMEAMTQEGKLLFDFMTTYVKEPKLKQKWLSLISNSGETFQGHLASAQTTLKPLGNSNIARMLSKNSINFKDLRKEKTILYLTFPSNEANFYTFILNLFYTQLFYELMTELPKKEELPIFILYDEFGHANIPNFDTTITNIRKYKVSLSLVLQSFSQLETQYGKEKAQTIIEGGVNSKLFYAGAGLETSKSIEKILGRVIRDEVYTTARDTTRIDRREFNLLNADEIRTLPDNQAFFITSNKKPILLDIQAYYQNRKYKNKTKYGEAVLAQNNFHKFELKSILDEAIKA